MSTLCSAAEQAAYRFARPRTIRGILFVVASFFVLSASMRAPCKAKETIEQASPVDEQRLQSSIKAVSEAVVRIKISSTQAHSGVIVSEQGYVMWSGSSHPRPDLFVALSTGESVPATNLGWSEEWRVGLLKLKGERKWPHVERGITAQAKSGDRIFEIGYRAKQGKEGEFDRVTRSGKLTLVSPSHWFATDLEPSRFEYGAGTFNSEGKLLGISVPGVSTVHHLCTAVDIVSFHWQDFVGGKNLDWVRFPPSKDSLYRRLAAPEQLDRTGFVPRKDVAEWKDAKGLVAIDEKTFRAARKIAAETTVRIRLRAPVKPEEKSYKSDCWSGVLISKDGYVATCAHTKQVAGEELIVVMPNSRELTAVALGTNWVSDVGIVKITEKGSWPHAELGDSSIIGPFGAVLCAGFPAPDATPLPTVTTDIFPKQRTPYLGWNHELTFDQGFKLMGGASGGGVFDRDGKLVAIYLGPGDGLRIETLRVQLEYLKQEKPMVGVRHTN
jgi:S1-C subfamily serine protease